VILFSEVMAMENHRDDVIIGAGAAGPSAAPVLKRARADVLVVEDGTPRNAPTAHVHGFVSRDGVNPAELLETGRREAGATSVPGVWACGNVVNPRAQAITAAGEASATAIAITSWLLEKDLEAAVERAGTNRPEGRS
jgi:thioredoxin reductase